MRVLLGCALEWMHRVAWRERACAPRSCMQPLVPPCHVLVSVALSPPPPHGGLCGLHDTRDAHMQHLSMPLPLHRHAAAANADRCSRHAAAACATLVLTAFLGHSFSSGLC